MEMDYQYQSEESISNQSEKSCLKLNTTTTTTIPTIRRPGRPRKSQTIEFSSSGSALAKIPLISSTSTSTSPGSPPIKMWEMGQELSSSSSNNNDGKLSSIDPRFKNAIQARRTRERKKEEEKALRQTINQLSSNLNHANHEILTKNTLIKSLEREKEILEKTVSSQVALLEKFKDEIIHDLTLTSNNNSEIPTTMSNKKQQQQQVIVLCPGLLAREQQQKSKQLSKSTPRNMNTPAFSLPDHGLAKISFGNAIYYDAVPGNQLPKISSSSSSGFFN